MKGLYIVWIGANQLLLANNYGLDRPFVWGSLPSRKTTATALQLWAFKTKEC